MNKLRSLLLSFTLWLIVVVPQLTANEAFPANFLYKRDVEINQLKQEELVSFTLDEALLRHTKFLHPDIRVLSSDNTNLIHLIESVYAYKVHTKTISIDPGVISLSEKDNQISITLKIHKDSSPVTGINIDTPIKDYERTITVETSDDMKNWSKLTSDQLIYDYSRYMDFRKTWINLPNHKQSNYYRLTISEASEEQKSNIKTIKDKFNLVNKTGSEHTYSVTKRNFKLNKVTFNKKIKEKSKRNIVLENRPISFNIDGTGDTENMSIIVNTDQLPVQALDLKTNSNFFHHKYKLYYLNTDEEWKEITRGSLKKILFKNHNEQKLTINFSEIKVQKMLIIIHHGEQEPLNIAGINGKTAKKRLSFMAQPKQNYTLYYSLLSVDSIAEDKTNILKSLLKNYKSQSVSLSEEVENPLYSKDRDKLNRNILGNINFLYGVLFFMVAVLSWILIKTAAKYTKDMNSSPE